MFKKCLFATMVATLALSADALNMRAMKADAIKSMQSAAEKPLKHRMKFLQTGTTATATAGGSAMSAEEMTLETAMVMCIQKNSDWGTWFNGVSEKCTDMSVLSMDFSGKTRAEVVKQFDAFCGSACYSAITGIPSDLKECMGKPGNEFIGQMTWMCEKGENGEVCGAVMYDFMQFALCGLNTMDTCGKTSTLCKWDATKTRCDVNLGADVMNLMCGTCFTKLITGPAAGQLGGSSDSIASQRGMLCSKSSDGKYCMLQFTEDEMDKFDNMTSTTLDAICTVPAKKECLVKLMGAAKPSMAQNIQKSFEYCQRSYHYEGSTMVKNDAAYCGKKYYMEHAEMHRGFGAISRMCMKNPVNNKYCIAMVAEDVMPKMKANPECDKLSSTCSATCDTIFKGIFDNMGCCFGMVQEVFFSTGPMPPQPIGATLTPPAPAPTLAAADFKAESATEVRIDPVQIPANSLVELDNCASLKGQVKPQLSVQCGKKTAPVLKKMPLKLSYKAIKADAKLEAKIKQSLRSDVAANIGCSSDDIKNDKLVENTNLKIEVKSAARRMRTLATESGCTYEFELAAVDPEVQAAASASFDTKKSTGDITMTETATVATKECTTCVSTTASGSTAAQLTQAESSAAATSVVAAVVAVLALVL